MRKLDILKDTDFQYGFKIIAPTHGNEKTITLNGFQSEEEPRWKLAQWFCKNDLREAKVLKNDEGYDIEGLSQSISVSDEGIRLELRTENEFCGSPRSAGEEWPHLLLEQATRSWCPPLRDLASLRLKCRVKLDYFKSHMVSPDDNVHATHAHMYFSVGSTVANEFFWLGIPFFDNRYAFVPQYMAIDCGKEDASGMMIYILPQTKLVNRSAHSKEWLTYDVDLLQELKEVFAVLKANHCMKNTRFEELIINSFNFGFEMFGEYDGAFQIENLSLQGEYKG